MGIKLQANAKHKGRGRGEVSEGLLLSTPPHPPCDGVKQTLMHTC